MHGVALSTHRSKSLTDEVVADADLLIVMDPVQQRLIRERFADGDREVVILGDLDPLQIDSRVIPDPVDQSVEAFEQAYARIARCVRELARAIGGRLPPMPKEKGRIG
jgi:protein-tyrosine-phosphatase